MKIQEVSSLDVAFGNASFLPPKDEIPQEFWSGHTKWNKAFSEWFYRGTSTDKFKPKKGIDRKQAIKMIAACMASWEPAHEYKEAGCAYMMSEFFEDFQ